MNLLSILIVISVSIAVNMFLTSFMIARAYHSRKLVRELEDTIFALVKNVDSATNEQLVLAENNINELKKTIKTGTELHAALSAFDFNKYRKLLAYVNALNEGCGEIIQNSKGEIKRSAERELLSSGNLDSVNKKSKEKNTAETLATKERSKENSGKVDESFYKKLSHDEIELLMIK